MIIHPILSAALALLATATPIDQQQQQQQPILQEAEEQGKHVDVIKESVLQLIESINNP